ncbi:response regulator transcription factor [Cohnella ginsengisoli]|uniref:response regulator transcription factor n=1 Tax=Cohnella ginsengisoli TaxID=425004 RepID=UPI003B8A93CD
MPRPKCREDRSDDKDTLEASKPAISIVVALTSREVDILRLMGEGLSNKQIAFQLSITEGTVKTHVINVYGKLQVNKRVQAINKAKELQLLN